MPLHFQPKEGAILICDFAGLVVPEMVKKRPVVVIRKHRHNSKLVTIVPLSTTAPDSLEDYHVEMSSGLSHGEACWAKCDMIYTLAIHRLDRVMQRDRRGNRNYVTLHASADDLGVIREAVRCGLGL